MKRALGTGLLVLIAACASGGPEESRSAPEWVHERTEEGGKTVVRTLAGSQWGGPAVLVEELSIGVLEGAEEYMLGQVSAVAVDETKVYVVDSQPALVKVYDRQTGDFLYTVGAGGEGPGEYQDPFMLRVVGDQLFVQDGGTSRISVFGVDGTFSHTLGLGTQMFGSSFVVAGDGAAYVETIQFLDESGTMLPAGERRRGLQLVDADGPQGDPFFAPAMDSGSDAYTMVAQGGRSGTRVPFAPGTPAGIAAAPAIVGGVSSEYAFEIHFLDGRILRAERYWEPVLISDAERAHHRAFTTARMRMRVPDWTWNGPAIPAHKPAYASIIPDHGERILVVRYQAGERGEDCTERPAVEDLEARRQICWAEKYAWDFFDWEGNYLGEVIRPDIRILSSPYMRDGTFAFAVDDDDGAVRVKVYRVVLPGDPGDS